jgi:hypothetical protein
MSHYAQHYAQHIEQDPMELDEDLYGKPYGWFSFVPC